MVLVDTSVWADFLNGFPSAQADQLAAYLQSDLDVATCGLVLTEVFQGLREGRKLRRLERLFGDLAYLAPDEPGTYQRAAQLFRDLRGSGVTVRSTVDCLIAQLASEHGCAVLAKDRDFEYILASGLLDLPPLPSIEQNP